MTAMAQIKKATKKVTPKRAVRTAKRALGGQSKSMSGLAGLASGIGLDSALDFAKGGASALGGQIGRVPRAFKGKNVVPVAIGSLIVGAVIGGLAVALFPRVRDSAFMGSVGEKLSQAKDVVAEGIATASQSVSGTVGQLLKGKSLDGIETTNLTSQSTASRPS